MGSKIRGMRFAEGVLWIWERESKVEERSVREPVRAK